MPAIKYTDRLLIRQIASRTGLTVSSVYKILSGASGFSQSTRERVERMAQELQVRLPTMPASGVFTVGVLIPEHPTYFWSEAISGIRRTVQTLREERGIRVETVFRFVHFPISDSAVEAALEPFSGEGCNAYILYPADCPAFLRFFTAIPSGVPVVLFNDLPEDSDRLRTLRERPLTVYVGADNYDEGILAAHVLGARLSGMRNVLALLSEDSLGTTAAKRRIAGFTHAATEINPGLSVRTDFVAVNGKLAAAFLAARIEPEILSGGMDCIYVSTGVTHIASAAIAKVRRRNCLPPGTYPLCLGHECSPSDRLYLLDGTQCGYVKQDIYSQARAAVEHLAEAFLSGATMQDVYIRSSVFINGGER